LYAVLIFSMLAKQAAHPLFILSSYWYLLKNINMKFLVMQFSPNSC
jgi:hypothetical protein